MPMCVGGRPVSSQSDRDLGPHVLTMPLVDLQESAAHERVVHLYADNLRRIATGESELFQAEVQKALRQEGMAETDLMKYGSQLWATDGPASDAPADMLVRTSSNMTSSPSRTRSPGLGASNPIASWSPRTSDRWQALALAEFAVRCGGARRERPPGRLEEGERQLALPDGREDGLGRQPGRLPGVQKGDTMDVLFGVPVAVAFQSAQLGKAEHVVGIHVCPGSPPRRVTGIP
jgi:hypothetical protein